MRPGIANWKFRGHPLTGLIVLAMLLTGVTRACAQDQGTGTPPGQSSSASATQQQPSSNTASTQSADTATNPKEEVSTRDTGTTFKVRVNLVQVRVVVRDNKGKLIEGLKREDFQVYDQGKLQALTTFDVETSESRRARTEAAARTQQAAEEETHGQKMALPERFVALVFDDIHLRMDDAMTVRMSAKALVESMAPTDRIGIFTTSEQVKHEFTNDKAVLEKALIEIIPRPRMGMVKTGTECPDVNHYMADQWVNKSNNMVLEITAQDVLQCLFGGDPRELAAARAYAATALQMELTAGDTDNDYTYRALEDVIRKLSAMPGERILVLASPGFLQSTQFLDLSGIVDRANRANTVINTVDARGLYTPIAGSDASSPGRDTPQTAGYKTTYRLSEQSENAFVLEEFALGTGGTFFHNSNDLQGGLTRAGAAPEVSYMLGFSPQNQRMDGKYHTIKVVLLRKEKYEIQARRGYYAPKKLDDPQEQAKKEIVEAVFSQDEIRDLALELQTQYFKADQTQAHLSVVSRIELKGIHFRKAEGRSFDNLTVATAIFDENGNFVTGGEKLLQMRLLDTTYERLSRTGLTMKSSFDLKPGKYLVRQVVRDSEGAQMAARNGAVVIPY